MPRPAPSQGILTPDLSDQLLEMIDRAASADPAMHCVAAGAQLSILGLEVEAAVEIEPRAILVELGPDPCPAGEDEVDLFGAGQQGAANGADGHAFGRLLLDPLDLRVACVRFDRHAQDHLLLDDEP